MIEPDEDAPPFRDNGIDTEALASFVARIEILQNEIDEIGARAREEAAPIREDIKAIKLKAHDAGIGKAEFAAVLRRRRLEHKAAHASDGLDLDQRANYAEMIASLERLAEQMPGLGQAALDHART